MIHSQPVSNSFDSLAGSSHPLSLVDAHVGKTLFADAIIGALRSQGKAVILVTHALHFLSQCDRIYTLDHGRIVEEGTYAELIAANGEFARLDREFGGASAHEQEAAEEEEAIEEEDVKTVLQPNLEAAKAKSRKRTGAGTGKLEGRLIISEKRSTGSVSWSSTSLPRTSLPQLTNLCTVYWEYLKAGRGAITGPLLIIFLVLMQVAFVLNTYALVWWQTKYVFICN